MDQPKQQLVEKLKAASYVLATVSRNPSVDQLAALVGLTLLLNKAGKHAAGVFSGTIPSTLEFLKPEDTIEKTTDSMRDFIIALDKSKADKLRYKVENDVVRIFITPYKTSITQEDLNFSQGDFNVDVVVGLGVTEQADMDEAITSHGRILHDATVATINTSAQGDLGSIHWQNPKASSLSELITELAQAMGEDMLDGQIATALLTGIVAETERFSNEKTTATVMSASAALMAAGANQQLVATELQQPTVEQPAAVQQVEDNNVVSLEPTVDSPEPPAVNEDGAMAIDHNNETAIVGAPPSEEFKLPEYAEPTPAAEPELPAPQDLPTPDEPTEPENPEHVTGGSRRITEAPSMGGQLTANSEVERLEPSSDPFSQPSMGQGKMLSRKPAIEPITVDATPPAAVAADVLPPAALTPPPPAWTPPTDSDKTIPPAIDKPQTLSELEQSVHQANPDSLDAARDEVSRALNSDSSQPLPPVTALNAQPLGEDLHPDFAAFGISSDPTPAPTSDQPAAGPEFTDVLQQQIPSLPVPPSAPQAALAPQPNTTPQVFDPNAAPPVPPPMNFGPPPQS